MITTITIVITTIFFSAFFSAMEIAFLSSNKLKLEIEKKSSRAFNFVANLFTNNPGQYITTILVGNNIALVVYSMQMVVLMNLLIGKSSILLETIVSTIVIIFAAEFIPKAVVKANPNFYLRTFYLPVYLFYILFYPIAKFATILSKIILLVFGLKVRSNSYITTFDKVDLAHLVEQASDGETQQSNEDDIKLFQNALEFPDLCARDCMVPRIDIYAVDIEGSLDELKKIFTDTRFSRILVYEGSIDNIIGYVNSKSLFTSPQTVRPIMRELIYVPESMKVDKILSNFIKKNLSIAVVIDEFGGTAGMITIEDMLEEIFGEIEDEHDSQEFTERDLGDGTYILSGRLEIEYLNEKYNLTIAESDDYDTLAGYIILNNNGLPKQGEEIVIDGYTLKILKMSSSRIDLIKLIVK